MSNQIFIDDRGRNGVMNSILQAKKILKDGMSLVIFPEGSRTLDGQIHRFKKGAFLLAEEMKMPVIPLVVEGPYKVLKRGTFLLYPSKLTLTILPELDFNPDVADDADFRMKKSFEQISAVLDSEK